jgi:hypothetical protein
VASEQDQVWETLGSPSAEDRFNHAARHFLPHPSLPTLSDPLLQGLSVVFSRSALIQPHGLTAAEALPTVLSHEEAWADTNSDGRLGSEERQTALPLVLARSPSNDHLAPSLVLADSTALSDRWALHPGNRAFLRDALTWLLPERPIPATKTLKALPEVVSPEPAFQGQQGLHELQLIQPERTLRLQHDGANSWVIRERSDGTQERFKGNSSVDAMWSAFSPLQALRTWSMPNSERLAALGFRGNPPILRLIEQDGSQRDLHLGGKPFNGSGRYAWEPIGNRILLLSSTDLQIILSPPERLGLPPSKP